MTTKTKITTAILTILACIAAIAETQLESIKAQEAQAEAFNKTNTDRTRMAVIFRNVSQWQPQKGEIETGYRSDGMVVWRVLPEGK